MESNNDVVKLNKINTKSITPTAFGFVVFQVSRMLCIGFLLCGLRVCISAPWVGGLLPADWLDLWRALDWLVWQSSLTGCRLRQSSWQAIECNAAVRFFTFANPKVKVSLPRSILLRQIWKKVTRVGGFLFPFISLRSRARKSKFLYPGVFCLVRFEKGLRGSADSCFPSFLYIREPESRNVFLQEYSV